jgi:broad specificity phosphatase PhoE
VIEFVALRGKNNFYFLRHGESEGNNARLIQGRSDFPLSENGRRQARAVAPWFAPRGIGLILCSPLLRARQTAEELAALLGVGELRPSGALTELDTGLFTGLGVDAIVTRHPEAWRSFREHSWEGVPGAEPVESLRRRAEQVWAELAGLHAEGLRNPLCVTHSGIMQWLLKATFGQRSWMPIIPMGNCAVCQLTLDNGVEGEAPRFYWEWSRLGYQPDDQGGEIDHLFR